MAGVKMTGGEFKAFFADPVVWGNPDNQQGAWCDDTLIEVDGVEVEDFEAEKIADEAKVKVICGVMCCRPNGVPESFEGAARWWLKRQAMTTLMVECNKDARDAVVVAIKAAGGKVL